MPGRANERKGHAKENKSRGKEACAEREGAVVSMPIGKQESIEWQNKSTTVTVLINKSQLHEYNPLWELS